MEFLPLFGVSSNITIYKQQCAKKIIFTAYHLGKLKLAFTLSPDVISTSPRCFLTSRIDFIVLLFNIRIAQKTSLACQAT